MQAVQCLDRLRRGLGPWKQALHTFLAGLFHKLWVVPAVLLVQRRSVLLTRGGVPGTVRCPCLETKADKAWGTWGMMPDTPHFRDPCHSDPCLPPSQLDMTSSLGLLGPVRYLCVGHFGILCGQPQREHTDSLVPWLSLGLLSLGMSCCVTCPYNLSWLCYRQLGTLEEIHRFPRRKAETPPWPQGSTDTSTLGLRARSTCT